jgi:hypothetical protein
MMSTLSQLIKDQNEAYNGRIWYTPGNWVFEPTPQQLKLRNRSRKDATGREMYLVRQRGVDCFNPDVGEGQYPKSTSSSCWFIPWSVCRKCQYYRKGGTDGLRYPHCAWLRERRGGDRGAAKARIAALGKAIKFADEMMR